MSSSPSGYVDLTKECACCGCVYDWMAWKRLKLVGYVGDAGVVLELRQCPCSTSLGMRVAAA